MRKILFLIHDLGQGGAEKVLVNLVNNMDRLKFDISVTVLFGGGVNEQFLKPDIHFHAVFPREVPGNSKLMKILTPKQLHKLCVKEYYDIEVSYLEGPSARVISGCQNVNTKLVAWIHGTLTDVSDASGSFRNMREARKCYGRFDQIVCVSKQVKQAFENMFPEMANIKVLYNTIDSNKILKLAQLPVCNEMYHNDEIKLIAAGSMKPVKAFDRLIRIHTDLREKGYSIHTYFLGKGPELKKLKNQVECLGQKDTVTFLGYDTNPYKYISKANLFICCSLSEGFSTAVTEALIVGTPVCTVDVSGMKELLGDHDEWGVVTRNDEEALCQGIQHLLNNPELLTYYKERASLRGKSFSVEKTVKAVEKMLLQE